MCSHTHELENTSSFYAYRVYRGSCPLFVDLTSYPDDLERYSAVGALYLYRLLIAAAVRPIPS